MISYSCDVCGKTREPSTYEVDGFRALPVGWFRRPGRVPSRGTHAHEIVVMCCSQQCCKAYDKVEAEQVGFSWGKIVVVSSDPDPTESVRPLVVEKKGED